MLEATTTLPPRPRLPPSPLTDVVAPGESRLDDVEIHLLALGRDIDLTRGGRLRQADLGSPGRAGAGQRRAAEVGVAVGVQIQARTAGKEGGDNGWGLFTQAEVDAVPAQANTAADVLNRLPVLAER